MAMGQFKEWVKQFDRDADGRISRDELQEAIRSTRAWFSDWKAGRGIKAADGNGDGFIDDSEMTALWSTQEKICPSKLCHKRVVVGSWGSFIFGITQVFPNKAA
ncbi:hypothetical protein RHGRI_021879 [Rhododendron griersonianum]|uniref:EF-hand domain-containing protein n=1 Tax=Rhododendron griersonianum TaxID=479676 RepID=A0AAV6JPZ9_9ERIC|nr:hypothetical protein RHGRI_021879 [Rhododendron griersonianum]